MQSAYLNNLVSFFFFVFGRIEMMSLLALLLFAQHGWTTQCDRDSGPSCATGCLQISRYNNQYQWTTCVTNAYIQQKKRSPENLLLEPVYARGAQQRQWPRDQTLLLQPKLVHYTH